jgi:beta-galactosidase
VDYLNSLAIVFVDGAKAGELRYPAGQVDLTAACRPGSKHSLSLLVVALPLKGVMLSYADTNAARAVKGTVERRGICGDVFLRSVPAESRIVDVRMEPSVRKGTITCSAKIERLKADAAYTVHVEIQDHGSPVRAFSAPVKAADLKDGRINLTETWLPKEFWDIHTPQHMLSARVSLLEGRRIRDVYCTVPFGFREFWIDGRDFYLNGSRIYISAVPLDNAQLGARTATYACSGDRHIFC